MSYWKPFGIVVGLGSFAGSHMILSHEPIRDKLIKDYGSDKFKLIYSGVAASIFFPTVYFYIKKARGTGPLLYNPGFLSKTLGFGLQSAGAVTFGQAIYQPSPIAEKAMNGNTDVSVTGIYRVSRHALFLSFALMGTGGLFLRGHLSDVLFSSFWPLFWGIGSYHQDLRMAKSMPPEFYASTSLLPFQAILEKRQEWESAWNEMDKKVVFISLLSPIFFIL